MITHYYTERRDVPIGEACPLCGKGKTVVRSNKRTKVEFVGCDRFPSCAFSASSIQAERLRKRSLRNISIGYEAGADGEPFDSLRPY